MNDDTMSGGRNENSGQKTSIREGFNQKLELEERISKTSPKTQEMIKNVGELANERTEKELRDQKRHHKFRALKRENELFEKYIQDNANRPESARLDPSQDIEIIKQTAEEQVRRKEEYHLKSIYVETDKNIKLLVERDEQSRRNAPDLKKDFQHEHERER